MKRLKISAATFGLALAFAVVSSAGGVETARAAGNCNAKICDVGGETGVCCLQVSGSVGCADCGAVDVE